MMHIKPATLQDLAGIVAIYNQAVLKTTATFDTEVKTIEQHKPWFDVHSTKYPLLVAEIDNIIVGWASLTPWSDRCAYSDTAEISIYIDEAQQSKGIGTQLMADIIKAGDKGCLHTILARIAEGNKISLALHQRVGFEVIGNMREVGRKFGKLLDVLLMQKIYKR